MSDQEYNPNSVDAVLSRIEQRQIENGEKLDKAIEAQADHDKRIADLEGSKKYLLGGAAVVTVILTGIWEWAKETFSK